MCRDAGTVCKNSCRVHKTNRPGDHSGLHRKPNETQLCMHAGCPTSLSPGGKPLVRGLMVEVARPRQCKQDIYVE